jgi:hypothetical protein
MIQAKEKPFDEIVRCVGERTRVLVVACGSCVTVNLSGGAREARRLAAALRRRLRRCGAEPDVAVVTLAHACEPDVAALAAPAATGREIVVSLACGAGTQTLGDVLKDVAVVPGVDTTFLGAAVGDAEWAEVCKGCGACLLERTAGLCPIARCAKRLLNGPCGGSRRGKCEVHESIECVWDRIVARLAERGQLDRYAAIEPPRDWRPAGGAGPRRRVRTGIGPARDR